MSSLRRVATCKTLKKSSSHVKLNAGHIARWRSSGGAPRRGGALKMASIGIGVTGVAAGALFVYSNYDPVFKNQVNEKIPGFGSWSDKAADLWVNTTGYFNSKQPGKSEDKNKLVFEHNQAKTKPSSDEPKKAQPTQPTQSPKTPQKPQSQSPPSTQSQSPPSAPQKPASSKDGIKKGEKKSTKAEPKGGKDKKDNSKTKVETPKRKEPTGKTEKGPAGAPNEKDLTGAPKEKGPAGAPKGKDPAAPKGKDPAAPKGKDLTGAPNEKDPTGKSKDTKSGVKEVSKSPTDSPPVQDSKVSTSPVPTEGTTAPALAEAPAPSAPPAPPIPPPDSKVVTGQSASAKIQQKLPDGSSSEKEDAPLNSSKMKGMLDKAHKKFKSEANRVKEAQSNLSRAWDDLYVKLTAAYPDVKQKDTAITEAKVATSKAHGELQKAAQEYDKSSRQLKGLVEMAPSKGFMSEANVIASDMKVKEAEVDLGLLLVKEAVTGAVVVEEYREAIQQSRDKLQKDLEAASSQIDPERKDSLLLSLSKKVELLDHKLNEAEAENAQKLMLALQVQKSSLEQVSKDKVEQMLKETEAKYQRELAENVEKIAANYIGILKEQLRIENESHDKEMAEALQDQEDELVSKWSADVELKLSEQQGFYQIELARARARLGGLEIMVDGVARAGEKTLQWQALRNSCDSLIRGLEWVNLEADTDRRYTIASELTSLRNAAGEDPFIPTVLDSIPPQAIGHGTGIQSEPGLRERFSKVKRICKRVAMVPETGAGLGTYTISCVQSFFTIRSGLSEIPEDVDPATLHMYDLLHLADVRQSKGDLEGAVHYMNYLQGEPKNVARDWLKDARLYLETKQAVQLLQAYMSANAMTINANNDTK